MSTYEISKSSLLSLKAEILRKQDELVKAKSENAIKIKNIRKNTPLEIKNKGVTERGRNDEVEDENLLKLSRATLEAKSKLYEKLSKNKPLSEAEKDYNRRYLVRFDKKNKICNDLPLSDDDDQPDVNKHPESEEDISEYEDYEPADPSEEWVEYTDCLGRTRTCLRKDLEYIKTKDSDLKKVVEHQEKEKSSIVNTQTTELNKTVVEENHVSQASELLSGDMRRELLRQQWEKEEEEMRNKSDIHYQNVLFNEARSHGVGYYAFSKDEEERAQQQEALKKLREETEAKQKRSQDLKAMRERQLAARMKAARNRKRARMGLPPEEDEPEVTEDKANEAQKKALEEEQKKKQEEEQERIAIEAARKLHLRPWDVGKEGAPSKEHYEMTQEEWVGKKREERPTEFAPPTNYNKTNKPSRDFRGAKNTTRSNVSNKNLLRFTTKKSAKNINDSNKRPINPYKNEDPNLGSCNNKFDVKAADSQTVDFDDRLLADYNQISNSEHIDILKNYKEIPQNKPMEPVPILDECDGDFDDCLLADYSKVMENVYKNLEEEPNSDSNSSLDDNYGGRGKGVEVAPPPMFEYYGPTDSKRAKVDAEKSCRSNIVDSVEAGLRFLRQEAEKKKRRHVEDRW